MAEAVGGTSRPFTSRQIGARERRLLPPVRRLLNAIRFTPTDLRMALAMRSLPPRALDQVARRMEDVKPDVIMALTPRFLRRDGTEAALNALWQLPPDLPVEELALRQAEVLARHLVNTTGETFKRVIAEHLAGKIPPGQLVDMAEEIVGLTPRDAGAVGNLYTRLVEQGTAPAVAQRQAKRYAKVLKRRRAQAIARTEATRHVNMLNMEAGRREAAKGVRVLKQWVSARDGNVCFVCQGLDDGSRIPLEESFSGGFMGPPSHPNCRCVLEMHRA